MSEDASQKHFDATPARKARAKRDGNVARSSEISGLAAFACAVMATFAVVPFIGASAARAIREVASLPDLGHVPLSLGAVAAYAIVPVLAAATGATGAGLVQGGGLNVTMPKIAFSKLHPVAGLKRMVGGEAFVGATRALLAFLIATVTLWPLAYEMFARSASIAGVVAFGVLVEGAAQRAFYSALAVGALFAIADYVLARRRWLKGLKMSFEDMKRDQKENDGDPHTRSRRKQMHRSFVRGSIQKTKDATFVLVNPTHIAIAIRYAPPTVAVPEILVRAADDAALAVRALATAHAIPIIENVPLARALYAQGEAGRAIPSDTFVAVARVIAALIREGVIT